MTYGPYGKGLAFQEVYRASGTVWSSEYPEIAEGSSNKYQNWEVVDPEKWVPDGYVMRSRRQPRRRPFAGRDRGLVAARDQGPLRLHRVGRGAALEQRQGRAQRHLLLRDEPVVGRLACSRRIWRRFACGRARRIITATSRGTAASCATFLRPGSTGRWSTLQYGYGERGSAAGSPASWSPGPETLPGRRAGQEPHRSRSGGSEAPARRHVLP